MESVERLAARWRADTQGHPRTDPLFADLCKRYGEPHRHYHTLRHLEDLFVTLDAHAAMLADVRAVAFAVWYHDVIYDTTRDDNEERSAALAAEVLKALDYPQSARVTHMILATKNHTQAPADADEALFLDADFSIVGAPESRYAAYTQEVRAEYGWLPDEAWRAGRLVFLTKAAEATRLFHTDAFEATLGSRARANIAWETARLRA